MLKSLGCALALAQLALPARATVVEIVGEGKVTEAWVQSYTNRQGQTVRLTPADISGIPHVKDRFAVTLRLGFEDPWDSVGTFTPRIDDIDYSTLWRRAVDGFAVTFSGGRIKALSVYGISDDTCGALTTLSKSPDDWHLRTSYDACLYFRDAMDGVSPFVGGRGTWTVTSMKVDGVEQRLPVPEPAGWALLLSGFAMTGAGLRRSRHVRSRRPG